MRPRSSSSRATRQAPGSRLGGCLAAILNAGISITNFSLSKDHLDNHFQINMLSQLHLALVLIPRCAPPPPPPGLPHALCHDYYWSKLAQILIVRELVRQGVDKGRHVLPTRLIQATSTLATAVATAGQDSIIVPDKQIRKLSAMAPAWGDGTATVTVEQGILEEKLDFLPYRMD
ncbi:hypothetical protein VTN77DRAFT_2756 [Rasamsonia byssochlamydoides]|uniref:uncharacterized protein n=1 Tax=Rasamsonia byssochlamydoides TaxID=89139 RepID=UPI0037429D0C